MSRQRGEGSGADGAPMGAVRGGHKVGPHARPLPVPIRISGDDRPGPAGGVTGVLYPEWDERKGRYRPDWCRVLELPLGPAPTPGEGGERDEVLHRRLARLGLGPMVQRGRPQGDDIDVDALIDATVDLRSGHSPREHVYLERRNLRRDLGVLVLLDASGSATETDPEGRSVHEHQRKAAATLVATLEELGDRVALYAFRSQGRSSVSMMPLKRFSARFGNSGRGWLSHLEPAGYTRMGAAIRHAGELLKHEAGTPSRLLVVLSDGFPYDDDYEGPYAEGDAHRALAELREDGVACVCLSIGTSTSVAALDRVFGAAAHAGAPLLSQLSGRIDTLFLSSLKELSRPRPPSEGRTARAGGATARRHRSPATFSSHPRSNA
jgi:nitric oxide reductase activation protein